MYVFVTTVLLFSILHYGTVCADEGRCPDITFRNVSKEIKASGALNFILRLIPFKIGTEVDRRTAEETIVQRLPLSEDKLAALIHYTVLCRSITVRQLSHDQEMRELSAAYQEAFFGRTTDNPIVEKASTPPPLSEQNKPVDKPVSQPVPQIAIPQMPSLPRVTVKVFPKANLGYQDLPALRSNLPSDYDVKAGFSDIDPRHEADALFVNPKQNSKEQVFIVLEALKKIGVEIKSIQKHPFTRKEIQVGTIVDPERDRSVFENTKPLNLDFLATLRGKDFWSEAANGQEWCQSGIGRAILCNH